MTKGIFDYLIDKSDVLNYRSKSIISDYKKIASFMKVNIISLKENNIKKAFLKKIYKPCGIADSLKTCLTNINDSNYNSIMNLLTRSFIPVEIKES